MRKFHEVLNKLYQHNSTTTLLQYKSKMTIFPTYTSKYSLALNIRETNEFHQVEV